MSVSEKEERPSLILRQCKIKCLKINEGNEPPMKRIIPHHKKNEKDGTNRKE